VPPKPLLGLTLSLPWSVQSGRPQPRLPPFTRGPRILVAGRRHRVRVILQIAGVVPRNPGANAQGVLAATSSISSPTVPTTDPGSPNLRRQREAGSRRRALRLLVKAK
jgi:hypothetical protein